jgi:hypothetical protein
MGIGSANANPSNGGGVDGGVGAGTAPATIEKVSLDSLLLLSKSELIHLRALNARDDTWVVIEGLTSSIHEMLVRDSDTVLQAFIDSTYAARRFLRALRGVSDEKWRQSIFAQHRALVTGRISLLVKEVGLTIDQINLEKRVLGFGGEETLRLRTLRQTLEEQRLRLRAAERFQTFLSEEWRFGELP